MMISLQVVLLLCAGCSFAEDLFSPSVNIMTEIEKLKTMEERMQRLEETLIKVLSENEALKTIVQEAQYQLQTLQHMNEVKKVAFSAGLLESGVGHTGPTNSQKILVYKKVFTNSGNAYNSDTGVFKAPVKGVYYFRFYAHSHAGPTMAVTLMKNGASVCSVHDWKPQGNGNASNGVVLTLEPGDEVDTRLWKNTWVYDDPASYTSFSGFLIFSL